jgi:hypothetical protein
LLEHVEIAPDINPDLQPLDREAEESTGEPVGTDDDELAAFKL